MMSVDRWLKLLVFGGLASAWGKWRKRDAISYIFSRCCGLVRPAKSMDYYELGQFLSSTTYKKGNKFNWHHKPLYNDDITFCKE